MIHSLPADDVATILNERPRSLGALLEWRVEKTPDLVAFTFPDANEKWCELTWTQTRARVQQIAAGMMALGIVPAERVAIMASTRIEWVLVDLAHNCSGITTTSIYPNTAADECDYLLQNSGAVGLVVENPDLLERVLATPSAQQLRMIVLLDGSHDDERVVSLEELERRGAEYLEHHPDAVDDAMAETGPDTLATLIYTSGTTGRPKGVELTHDNWVYEAAAMRTLDLITEGEDLHYVWLPMSHVFGKCLIGCDMIYGVTTAIDGRVDKIVSNLAVVRPTVMCGAPRIFEKVRAAVMTASPRSGVKGKISRWAFAVGRDAYPYRIKDKRLPPVLALRYRIADRLVYSQLRERMGGRMRFFISGSARLSPQVQEWFFSAGLVLIEGYGMTESTAISFLNDPRSPRFGTVGAVTPGSEVRIDDDGEILVKGPGITPGYFNDPERTAESIVDGWLRTGDIGYLDDEQNLHITDRKKDLLKTSGGKYVSPQKVEAAIAANCPYVSQVVAAGEGRKYVSALLVLDPESLQRWAKRHNMEDKSYAELSQLPRIRQSIERYVERANKHLERWETVKQFAILDHELTQDNDEVTANLKVRRRQVLEHHRDIVDSLYPSDDGSTRGQ